MSSLVFVYICLLFYFVLFCLFVSSHLDSWWDSNSDVSRCGVNLPCHIHRCQCSLTFLSVCPFVVVGFFIIFFLSCSASFKRVPHPIKSVFNFLGVFGEAALVVAASEAVTQSDDFNECSPRCCYCCCTYTVVTLNETIMFAYLLFLL